MDAACNKTYQRCVARNRARPGRAAHAGKLIEKWGTLHAVRTTLGALATLAYLWACMTR
jgi:hypothetical protein